MVSAGLTFLFLSTMVVNPLVTNSLIEADLVSNGRYAISFDAHESIELFDGFKATAIGSSIIRDAVDGLCISEKIDPNGSAGVFNLGISGGNPYTEMMQTQAIVNSGTDVVILELGPNSLWQFYDSKSLDDYIEFRFTINSITMEQDDLGGWTKLLRERDKEFVSMTDVERIGMTKIYSINSVEAKLSKLAVDLPEIRFSNSGIPSVNDANWLEYLMTPSYKPANFELKSSHEVDRYFEKNMPTLVNGSIYKPKSGGTLNHISVEYMLEEFTSSGIEVLLLGLPHHSQVYDYLRADQLDDFNSTFEKYSDYEGVHGLNMFWEEWPDWMFRDRNHLGSTGREYACDRISNAINEMTNDSLTPNDFTSTLEAHFDKKSQCNGSDLSWVAISEITLIQAEAYSFCAKAIDLRLPHEWKKNTEDSSISLTPDVGISPNRVDEGPLIGYNVTLINPGWYYFWFETKGESISDDTFAVSFERPDLPETSYSIVSSFGQGAGDYIWTNQSSMAPLKMWVPGHWEIKIKIWMQEDGVQLNQILISTDQFYNPNNEVLA